MNFTHAFKLDRHYATLIFFLREPDAGGEVVFPVLESNDIVADGKSFHYARISDTCTQDKNAISGSCLNGFDEASVNAYLSQLEQTTVLNNIDSTERFLESKKKLKYYPEDGVERKLLALCQSKFSVKVRKLEALLFYSQSADSFEIADFLSTYSHCPVVKVSCIIKFPYLPHSNLYDLFLIGRKMDCKNVSLEWTKKRLVAKSP